MHPTLAYALRFLLSTLKKLARFGMYWRFFLCCFIATALYLFATTNLLMIGFVLLLLITVTKLNHGIVDVFLKTIRRDLRALKALLHFKILQSKNVKHSRTIPCIFEGVMRQHPQKIALQWEDVSWTFLDLHEFSNSIGNYFFDCGYRSGDVVSIFVENRPEFVALWLGLSKIGVVCALINYNLREDALAHCVNISLSKGLIFSGQLAAAVGDIQEKLKGTINYYVICGSTSETPQFRNKATEIDNVLLNGLRLPPPLPSKTSYFDKLMYIYTSGTTGLPKAAVITHSRYFYMCTMQHLMLGYRENDSVYCALPLYHSNGGIVGLGQCLCHGLTLTIRSKFSARAFWSDCKKYNSTVILYIGEICRYLLAQPPKPSDVDHRVRVMTGNGLRPEIWKQFMERFNVSQVAEFYGATEGNANMINIDNKVGSCGFTSVLVPSAYPITLLKIDEDKELVRDGDDFCIKCQPGEVGMLVGKIVKDSLTQKFDGYADESESMKKIAFDVFEKGDCVFLTGDVLSMDRYGYMYFKDRVGDTFRWKGENVSTAECEAELAKILGNQHTVGVYGVSIPGTEGKAGMACIMDPERCVDLKAFYKCVQRGLVSYARPVFVRITSYMEITGTHKIKKVILKKEGYNIQTSKDPIYFMDVSKEEYVPLDQDLFRKIEYGQIRL
ncbi:unnamed protein product [Clavelina lepadiformis]|uniref:Long-chain-fatty-acid--CoA ligase n=1 Tax=Clavelina lepadiformis TaxID=159417 RepID=A0ABP0G0Z4_CLALP